MKRIIVILLAVLPVSVFAQRKGVYTDLVLEKLQFTDVQNAPLNADMLEVGKITRVGFRVANANMENAVPAGTCKLKLTLGTNCFPSVDLQGPDAPLPDYFHWTQSTDPFNQIIITGELYKNLPAGFTANAVFPVMPSKTGQSIITGHFLITNHKNPAFILSDLNAENNIISSGYTNLSPLTMKFTDFTAKAKACNLNINWQVSDENKISSFAVESSADGILFTTLQSISPNGTRSYFSTIGNIAGGSIFVRIKAEAQTGQVLYSGTAAVSNTCNGRLELALYPNPVIGNVSELTILAKEGILNGKYSIRLLDATGKEINRKEVQLINQDQVKYFTGFLTGGSYQLMITREDGETRSLRFVKQ
jgi:hypothetical protein